MYNTVRADFEVKNHQYALTKINQVLDWTGLILYIWSPKHILILMYIYEQAEGALTPTSVQVRQSHNASVDKTLLQRHRTQTSHSLLWRDLLFPRAFFILTKEIRPQRHLLAIWLFPPACPNWACFGGSRKKRPGKKSGDMLVLLVTMGDPSIAGYLRVWQRRYRRGTTLRHRTLTTYQATWR